MALIEATDADWVSSWCGAAAVAAVVWMGVARATAKMDGGGSGLRRHA